MLGPWLPWVLSACVGPGGPVDDTGACASDTSSPDLPATPGTETTERTYGTGLAWADVDGDGRLDLVLASGNDMQPGPVQVHFGRAGGTVPATPDWTSAGAHYHGQLAAGDIDGDGRDDLVVSRYLGDDRWGDPGGVDLYLGRDEPVLDASLEGFSTFAAALGDADGDGDLDLAVATGEIYRGEPEPDRLYLNEGGTFAAEPAWTSAPSWSLDVAFVDADADGDLDLAFARHGAPHARYDNDGGLPASPDWEAEGDVFDGNTLDFGDVDRDGRPDLLVSDTAPGTVTLYCGDDWTPCWSRPGAPVDASAVALRDVDGDGALDAVTGAWWGAVEVWPGRCEGGLEGVRAWTSDTTSVIEAFAWHDLDGAQEIEGTTAGRGLVALPRGARVVSTDPPGAAVGDGYVSVAGQAALEVRWVRSRRLDLAVSNWDPELGTFLFER